MRDFIESNKDNFRDFGRWLEDAMRHLTVFGFCLIVFSVVYWFGHADGERAGAARTKEAFEECGQPHCWQAWQRFPEPAP